MSQKSDNLFETPWQSQGSFRFDENVARVFPDMIRRSVPGYGHVIGLSGLIAKRYAISNTALYDLGCSLGATTLSMAQTVTKSGCEIIAVDSSQAMLHQAQKELAGKLNNSLPISWIKSDITTIDFVPCSVVALNFTLQFVALDQREILLKRIYTALRPGGVVVLAEKIIQESKKSESLINEFHMDFKRANGYSELEISGKRQAIENVLIPETSRTHTNRLRRAGFSEVTEFFNCLNFKAWVASK